MADSLTVQNFVSLIHVGLDARQTHKHKRRGAWREEERPVRGPAPVEDEDGLENMLVHVLDVSGQWLWTGILPEHMSMEEVQREFHKSEPIRFGLVDGRHFKLLWDFGVAGVSSGPVSPVPESRACLPVCGWRENLNGAKVLFRSAATRQVWITAIPVLII